MAPIEIIRSFYAALAAGDAPAALGLMAPDIEWTAMWPYRPDGRGPQKVAEGVFMPLQREWSEFTIVPTDYVAEGDRVVSIGRFVGRHGTTGRNVDAGYAHVWDVRDGQVTRFRQYIDTLLVESART